MNNFDENSPMCDFLKKPHYHIPRTTLGKGKNQTGELHTFPTTKTCTGHKIIIGENINGHFIFKEKTSINLKEM